MTQDNQTSNSDATLHATVRGHVQGVFFRAFVGQAAARLHVGGYVRNQPDGSVYVVARGPRRDLEQLLTLLWQGPDMARVSMVETEWLDGDTGVDAHRFEVRH